MIDFNKSYARTRIDAPKGGQVVVVGTNFTHPCRALWLSTGGTIEVMFVNGTTLVYNNVPAGRFVIEAIQVVSVIGAVVQNAEW